MTRSCFLDTDDLDWLGRFKHLNLSEAQIRGLIHAREAGRIDNETYRELERTQPDAPRSPNQKYRVSRNE